MATNTEIVQQALAAVRGGDLDAARAVVHEDFVWHIPGTSPISGDTTGVEAWSAQLQRLLGSGLQPQMLAMLEGPEHVAAIQRNTAEAGGHTLDVKVVNLFSIRNGKVARLDTFFGDQRAAETFWSGVLA